MDVDYHVVWLDLLDWCQTCHPRRQCTTSSVSRCSTSAPGPATSTGTTATEPVSLTTGTACGVCVCVQHVCVV